MTNPIDEQGLPFAPSCENNKDPILAVLQRHFIKGNTSQPATVLEIAGGTGQHAVHFAGRMSHLYWQSSELPQLVAVLNRRLHAAALPNLPLAVALDVMQDDWGIPEVDYIFTANSLHIMPVAAVEHCIRHAGTQLRKAGRLAVYGPFKYAGEFTTPSNANFDLWLKRQQVFSGVRDFEWVNMLAAAANLQLLEDNAMPANNQLLVWEKA